MNVLSMIELNVLEVAGSIAGLAGIALVVFYFLFRTIIVNALPTLTQNTRRVVVMTMLGMIWSVTVLGMTGWIYLNWKSDGGKQRLEEQEIVAGIIAKKQEVKLHGGLVYYKPFRSSKPLALKGCHFKAKSELWLSFNEDKPYYHDFGDMELVLKEMNLTTKKSVFLLKLKQTDEETLVKEFVLEEGEAFDFEYNTCSYRMVYEGVDSFTSGIEHWFKTRYVAKYKILPVNEIDV